MKKQMGGQGRVFVAVLLLAGCHDPGVKRGLGDLTASPQPLEFGAVALGRDRVMELSLVNRGAVSYNVYEVLPTVPNIEVLDFAPAPLGAGETRRVKVRFAPAVEGKITGAVTVMTDQTHEKVAIPLSGLGVKALAEVKQQLLDFGRVDVDTVKVMYLEVENPTRVETDLRLGFEGASASVFSSSEANRELLLEPLEKRLIPIAFRPSTLGQADAEAMVSICPGCEPWRVVLTGEGVANALEIFPTRIDFGRVALGATATSRVTLVNQGSEPLQFNGATLEQDSGGTLEVTAPVATVLGGASITVEVRFTPKLAGTIKNILRLDVVAANAPQHPRLSVVGEGGASCVSLLPREVDFGTVPEGMSATRRVDVMNRCAYPVQVVETLVSTQSGGYFSLGQLPGALTIGPGLIESLRVSFNPKPGTTASAGALTLKVAQNSALATEQVSLRGTTRTFAPCEWTLLPGSLNFGAVQVGAETTLGVTLRNGGSEDCFLGTMQLASGSDPEFSARPLQSTLLQPGEQAALRVTFKPSAVGSFAGLAEAWVSHPTNNHPQAGLIGQGVQGCFALQPTHLDYGTVKLSCGARTRSVTAFNSCSAPVAMQAASLDAPATADFAITSAPGALNLAPGQQVKIDVRYLPLNEGEDVGALRVVADSVMYTAGLTGIGLDKPTQTDRFSQESKAKVDILFVVDNSGSMMEEQQSLAQNFAAFMSAAQASMVDWQIGVTTTGIESSPGGWAVCPGGAQGGEGGRLFPVNGATPRIITPSTPNAPQVFAANVGVGVCHWNEQGLEAAYRALSPPLVDSADDPRTPQPADGNAGFLRPEAKLAIIFISDEDDFSPQPATFYETFFRSLKGNDPSMLSISAIVAPANLSTCPTASSSGLRYEAVARPTGGVVESICTSDWASTLTQISSTTFGPARRFPLSEKPSDPKQISVEVNGSVQSSGWSYNTATNTVEFTEAAAPPAGSVVEITYPLGC